MEYCNLDPETEPESDADLARGWPKYGIITAEGASFAHHKSLPYVLKTMFFCIRASEKVIQSDIRVIAYFYGEDEIPSLKITALRGSASRTIQSYQTSIKLFHHDYLPQEILKFVIFASR